MKESYWQKTVIMPSFPRLEKNITTDVLIIGGGLTGIMCAYYLKDSPYSITLVEQDTLGSKSSGKMTGKVSYIHGSRLGELSENFSELEALKYLKGNLEAYNAMLDNIKLHQISCDFVSEPQYFYEGKEKYLKKQYEMLKQCNLNVSYSNNCLKVEGLATFHPMKYLKGIVDTLKNVNIYEHTSITNHTYYSGEHHLKTNLFSDIKAKYVIVATRFPIFNFPSMYFLRMHQVTSVLHFNPQTETKVVLKTDQPIYSRRFIDLHQIEIAGERIVGQEPFKYANLDKLTWSNQDAVSHDGLPFIGEYQRGNQTMFVASGFGKWVR